MHGRDGETLIFHARGRRPPRGQSEVPSLARSSVRLVGPLDPQESHQLGIPIKEKDDEYGLIHQELWKVVGVIIVAGAWIKPQAGIGCPSYPR